MSSRWKKVWADFWGNKTRTVLTILTIAVGTIAVGFTNNTSLFMAESMESDFLSAKPSEAYVYAFPMTDETVKLARSVPGVKAVEGQSTFAGQLLSTSGKKITIAFTAVEEPSDLTLNLLMPVTGQTTVPALGDKQVLADSSMAPLGYKPGDVLTVEFDNGTRRDLRLAGYMHSPTGVPYGLGQVINAYVTPDTMVWLGGSREYNQLAISVTEKTTDATHVTAVAQAVADRVERSGLTVGYVYVYQPGHHYAYSIAQGMFSVLGILSWMTVLLSAILIINTITALMTQQTRQIGIMKANGAATGQLTAMYMVLILIFGLLALAVSIPLANGAAKSIGDGMAAYLNFYPAPYNGYTSTLIQQGIVALVVPLLAGLWPLRNSLRITVREALSDYGIGSSAKPRDKSIGRSTLLIPRPMRLSLRNTFRKKLRLSLTLFTLVLAGGLFIAVYNLWASFDKVINDIQGYFLADVNVTFAQGYRLDKVAPMAERIPGVQTVEGWLEFPGTYMPDDQSAGKQIMFVAPPSTSTLIQPVMSSGRWLAPGDENAIVIGNHLLNVYPNLKVGDWLKIKIGDKETNWHIVGTYVMTGNSSQPLLYTNYEYLSSLIGQPGTVYVLQVITTSHDRLTEKRVNDQLMALYAARGIRVAQTQLSADFIQSQTALTDIFVYFVLVMAVMIAIVGSLGLMGTMSINVMERTREIGVMRAIGASNWNIQSIVVVEGMVVGLISWVLSIGLSIPITVALCTGVGLAVLTTPMPAVYGISGIVIWLIGILIIGGLASALPAHRASSLTVRDTLAYE